MNTIHSFGLACLVSCSALVASGIEVGDSAPMFKALDQDNESWALSEKLGDKPLVIYFYPAAMTGGCTKQACAYRDYQMKENKSFNVVGISGDSVANLKWFQQAENLNFTLLSDLDGAVAKAFGVPVTAGEKTISRQVNGEDVELTRLVTTKRWTFILDADGKVVYRDDQVKALEDLSAVLEFLNK